MHYKLNNDNKLNSRIINYFSEITAISEDCRKEYLRSLLKRKNAESQKNVRLLKIIYGLIKNSSIGRWDNDKICKALSMSMTALYFNKHKILKGLRALHFGWNEIEKECPRGENTELQKAEKMFEIGMRREAKTKFIKIEKALFNSYESTRAAAHSKDFISLSMVYTHLIEYYFNIKNYPRVHFYLNRFDALFGSLGEMSLNKTEKSLFLVRYYLSQPKKYLFKAVSDKAYEKSIGLNTKAYRLAKNAGSSEYVLTALMRLGNNCINIKKMDDAARYFEQGSRVAENYGFRIEYLAFRSQLTWVNYKREGKDINANLRDVKKYYNEARTLRLRYGWHRYIYSALFDMLIANFEMEAYLVVFREHINNMILQTDGSNTWMYLNYLDLITCSENTYNWQVVKVRENEILLPGAVNLHALKELENFLKGLVVNFEKVFTIRFAYDIYMYHVWAEFWRGTGCDFNKALIFINKIEWILKTRHQIYSGNTFEALKLGVLMIEESEFKKQNYIIKKYLTKFRTIADNISGGKSHNILTDYAILCFISRTLGYSIFDKITRELFLKLKKNSTIPLDSFIQRVKVPGYTVVHEAA